MSDAAKSIKGASIIGTNIAARLSSPDRTVKVSMDAQICMCGMSKITNEEIDKIISEANAP